MKKLIATVLIGVMALSMVACGSKKTESTEAAEAAEALATVETLATAEAAGFSTVFSAEC